MQDLVFLKPIFGIIFFILGIFILYLFYYTKNFASEFRFISDLQKVFGKANKIFLGHLFFLFIILFIISIIIGDPNIKNTSKKITKNGIDIVLTLDLSYSMTAEDMKPNRLELAKEVLYNFVSKLESNRVGFVVFAGKPFISSPLTFDYNFLKDYIKKINIETINQDYQHLQGTAIGDALLYSASLFGSDNDREKVIVLFTDGEANRGIDPIDAIRFVKEKNITVHTVGIAGDNETFVTIKNEFGIQKIPISGIDEKNLKAIASLTNGKYYRVKDKNTFMQIFENLNLLQKKEIEAHTFVYYKDLYKYIYFILFLVSLLYLFYFLYYKDLKIGSYLFLTLILGFFVFLSFLGIIDFNINKIDKKKLSSSDIVFVLDVSASMLAFDNNDNKTRLEEAKEFIKEYIAKNSQNRYSFVIFSGEALSILPFTNDISLFLNMLDSIDNSFIPKNGTNIKDAFLESFNRFEDKDKTGGIIIISDFELPNTSSQVKENIINDISKFDFSKIKTVLVGVGDENGSKIIEGRDFFGDIVYKKDKFGKDIITILDTDFADRLKDSFNGEFFYLQNDNIKNIISKIQNFPSKFIDFEIQNKKNITYYFAYLLYFLFCFYIVSYFLIKRRLGK